MVQQISRYNVCNIIYCTRRSWSYLTALSFTSELTCPHQHNVCSTVITLCNIMYTPAYLSADWNARSHTCMYILACLHEHWTVTCYLQRLTWGPQFLYHGFTVYVSTLFWSGSEECNWLHVDFYVARSQYTIVHAQWWSLYRKYSIVTVFHATIVVIECENCVVGW